MRKYISLMLLLVFVILLYVFFYTDPSNVGPVGILSVFVLIYLICLILLSFIILFIIKFTNKLRRHFGFKDSGNSPNLYNSFLYGSVVALGLVVLLGRNSLGSIGLFEYILVVAFVFIGCFFVKKQVVK